MRLVTVDAGDGPLEIVCGATNFAVGNYVPLAPVGAVLPGGFEIAQRKMRGVTSNGMLCSARELRLSDDHEGLYILDDVIDPVVGQPLLEALGITRDVVFDISVEGNRPDAWSVRGVARDLATRLGRDAARARARDTRRAREDSSTFASAGIDDPDLCGRLTVSVLRDVVVRPSPAHLARRLIMAGMRPISNVVDASNLVMLELGQPTHPYDAAHVAQRTLRARRARVGRDPRRPSTASNAPSPNRDAGSAIPAKTASSSTATTAFSVSRASWAARRARSPPRPTDVLLEAAFFDPMTIARSSKRHALRSEASNRFERGVDPELALVAVGSIRRSTAREQSRGALDGRVRSTSRETCPSPPTVQSTRGRPGASPGRRPRPVTRCVAILEGLAVSRSAVMARGRVTAPSARLDVRIGRRRTRRRDRGDRAALRLLAPAAAHADLARTGRAQRSSAHASTTARHGRGSRRARVVDADPGQ